MSTDDRSSTTLRQFHCRDRLWQTFEQMSEEQEKSVEELINDAMSSYAQLAGYETAVHAQTPIPTPGPSPLPVPLQPGGSSLPAPRGPAPPPPRFPPGPPRGGGRATATASVAAPPAPPVEPGPGATLYLVFENQKYPIDKDQFIIGRGSKSSDLPIRDGNVSRKHAAVIRRNGAYFIKDLGSTNGIDFKGMRIDNKRIDEGDLFHICEYELKFTYKR
jgi:pSer/pThr/pTyr-binding forkhead associated (FHA) protein